MKSVWLGSSKGEERENMRAEVLQAQKVLDKLKEIVYNMRNEKSTVTTTDYGSPSWSHEQAHRNGYVDACDRIVSLLTLDPTN